MVSMPIASKKFFLSIGSLLGQYSHRSRIARSIAVMAIVTLATASVAGWVVAQEGFPLIGSWRHTEPATQNTPAFSITQVFNPDGTFYVEEMIAPRPGMVGTIVRYWGRYRGTSATSIVYQVQSFQACSSGGACTSCPGDQMTCTLAQQSGADPGVQHQGNFQMRGANEFVDKSGLQWLRIR